MIKAQHSDKKRIIDILHSAFEPIHEANSINFIVKQDNKRSELLRALMEYLVEDCMDYGEILMSDQRNACILVKYNNLHKPKIKDYWRQAKLAIKCIGLSNVGKVLQRQKLIKKNHPKETYVHPVIMGATNEVKGFGYGVRLMMQLRDENPDNILPVITETTTDVNLNIYKRFGFELYNQIDTESFPIYFLRLN